jgi:hypothetical protein
VLSILIPCLLLSEYTVCPASALFTTFVLYVFRRMDYPRATDAENRLLSKGLAIIEKWWPVVYGEASCTYKFHVSPSGRFRSIPTTCRREIFRAV